MEIISNHTNIDFVGRRKPAAILSLIMVLASLALFFVRGPTWGIDFTGGTEIHLKFNAPTEIGEIRDALTAEGLSGDAVQQIGSPEDYEFVIRIQDPSFGTEGIQSDVEQRLKSRFGQDWIKASSFDAQIGARLMVEYNGPDINPREISAALLDVPGASVQEANDDNLFYVKLPGMSTKISASLRNRLDGKGFDILQTDSVGPKVGGELKRQGVISLISTLGLILVYVAFRFNLSFAPGAVLALFHDVCIVVGVFIICDMLGWTHEFNLPMVGALLTIIGYSLNDTIVIYDRIRENMTRYRRKEMPKLINDSINETLRRTIATSLTTMMAMLAFLVLGGPVIQTFALAIFMGVIFGTYSTVFVASPTILLMQDLRPHLGRFFTPLAEGSTEGEESEDEQMLTQAEQRRRVRQGLAVGATQDSP